MSTQESSERTRRTKNKLKTATIFQFILIELYKEPHTFNCVFIKNMRCVKKKIIGEKKQRQSFGFVLKNTKKKIPIEPT